MYELFAFSYFYDLDIDKLAFNIFDSFFFLSHISIVLELDSETYLLDFSSFFFFPFFVIIARNKRGDLVDAKTPNRHAQHRASKCAQSRQACGSSFARIAYYLYAVLHVCAKLQRSHFRLRECHAIWRACPTSCLYTKYTLHTVNCIHNQTVA